MAQDELDQVEDLVEGSPLYVFSKTSPDSRRFGIPLVQRSMVEITMLRLQNLVPGSCDPRSAIQYIQLPPVVVDRLM